MKYKHLPSGIIAEKMNTMGDTWRTEKGEFLPLWIVQGKDWEEVPERAFLFETEDGVGKFKGDNCFYVDKKWRVCTWSVLPYPLHCTSVPQSEIDNYVFFDNKEAAKDYVMNHKPCLSLSDIIVLMPDHLKYQQFSTKLLALVKSKLSIP